MGFNRFFRLLQKSASSPYCRGGSISPLLSHKTSFYPCRAIIPRAVFSANAKTAAATDPKLGFVVNHIQDLQSHKTEHTASQHIEEEEEEENDVPEEAKGAEFDSKLEIQHPWPEWISLMERLVENNYFESIASSDEDEEGSNTSAMFKDLNRVRNACLNFGRDRFDILRTLSMEDIKAIVEYGCPSTDRKVVNSGKRLRAYVNLDEGDVCSTCNLRGSCDRAYVKARQEEGARTVDIMRFLLTYGLDPLVGSAENKLHMRKTVKVSVRKLLKEVVEFSATPLDPILPNPMAKQPLPRMRQSPLTDVEMKKGDWLCPRCNIIIFARNTACIQCHEKRPKRPLNPGEWCCPVCDFLNFSRNMTCLKCDCKCPKDDHTQNAKQVWKDYRTDPMSDFQQSKYLEQKLQNPGDWLCPSCKFINFRRNMTCLKCDCKRPKDEHTHNSRQGLNDYQTDAMNNFQQSKHLEQKLKNPDRTANPSNALNDEYDHGSISDDDLLNSARSRGRGINDGNFDFDDFPVRGGKSGRTVGRKKEQNEKKTLSSRDLGVDKRLRSSSAKASHFSDLDIDDDVSDLDLDDDDDDEDAVDSNWKKASSGNVSGRYGRDSNSAREKGRAHNYDDTDDEDGWFGSDQRKQSGSFERSSFLKPIGEKNSFKKFGDLDLDDDDGDDDIFESEDEQPQTSRLKLRGEEARSSTRGERRTQNRRVKDPSSASQVRGSEENDDDFDELIDLFESEDEQPQIPRSKLREEERRPTGRGGYRIESKRAREPSSASRGSGREGRK